MVEPSKSSAEEVGSSTRASSTRVAEIEHTIAEAVARKDYAAAAALAHDLEVARQGALRHVELERAVEAAVAQKDFAMVCQLSAELKSLEEAEATGVGLAC